MAPTAVAQLEEWFKVVGRGFAALLAALGAPVGPKAKQDFALPVWLDGALDMSDGVESSVASPPVVPCERAIGSDAPPLQPTTAAKEQKRRREESFDASMRSTSAPLVPCATLVQVHEMTALTSCANDDP